MKFWTQAPVSSADREITDSLKALKTLTYAEGRVSIDPSEVISRPGYLEARRSAARLARPATHACAWQSWEDVDAAGLEQFLLVLMEQLRQSRAQGLSLAEGLNQLSRLSHL